MISLLHDAPVRDHRDLVGVLDGGKTVSHHDGGAALAQLVQSLLDQDLGGVVQGRGSLVQNEDGGIFQKHAGDGQSLLLSARQPHATLADDRLIAVLQSHDVVVDVGPLGGLDDLLLGGVQTAVEDVVADGGVEQVNVLLDDTDIAAHRGHGHGVKLFSVNENFTVHAIVEVGDQMADGGLTAARGAYQRVGLTLLDLQGIILVLKMVVNYLECC